MHSLEEFPIVEPMKVENTKFLLELMGERCGPLHFLREYTQNSIEAIKRKDDPTGTIIWDYDHMHDQKGIKKLCITDDGIGMSHDEMRRYINNLFASSSTQSLSGNFGIGAKISAVLYNPYGILYVSRKEERIFQVDFASDRNSNFGLAQIEHSNGEAHYFREIDVDKWKTEFPKTGTRVTFMGQALNSDTMQAPPKSPSPSRWIAHYLNRRYFRFPAGITVKAREGWKYPAEDTDRNLLRTVTGAKSHLDGHCSNKGKVKLSRATVHWWLFETDSDATSKASGAYALPGHIAVLYKDEIYDMATLRCAVSRITRFGVVYGQKKIVLYVEPDQRTCRITSDPSRRSLLLDGGELPWNDWADEFKAQMPDSIREFVERQASLEVIPLDHAEAIKNRLQPLLSLWQPSLLKRARNEDGSFALNARKNQGIGGLSRPDPRTNEDLETIGDEAQNPSPSVARRRKRADIYGSAEKEGDAVGRRVNDIHFPQVQWVNADAQSVDPSEFRDRVAQFHPSENLLKINFIYSGFFTIAQMFEETTQGDDKKTQELMNCIRQWTEQALVEAIIGMRSRQGSKFWTTQDIEAAWSPEALTAIVMNRYHVFHQVKRAVNSTMRG